jgi:predicted DNA-binding transcriptional regulator AlpA
MHPSHHSPAGPRNDIPDIPNGSLDELQGPQIGPRVNCPAHPTANANEFLTLLELADWLRCSVRTVQRLMETGEGPPVIRLSERRIIFRLSDAQRWLEGRAR